MEGSGAAGPEKKGREGERRGQKNLKKMVRNAKVDRGLRTERTEAGVGGGTHKRKNEGSRSPGWRLTL